MASMRIVKGFLDLLTVKFLTGFGQRPQHVLGTVGLASFVVGALGLVYLAGCWAVSRMSGMQPIHLHERPAVLYSLGLLLLGGQLMSIGFLAELFIAYHASEAHSYSISERTSPPIGAGMDDGTKASETSPISRSQMPDVFHDQPRKP